MSIEIPKHDKEKPVNILITSTFSPKHEAAIGESLGSEALAGHLIGENGDAVKVGHVDMQLEPEVDKLAQKVYQEKPNILGVSVKIGSLDQTDKIINSINQQPWKAGEKPLIVLGGVVPTFASAEILKRYPGVVVAKGEGEEAIQSLFHVAKGEKNLEQVPGISFQNPDGSQHTTLPKSFPLEKLHFPARLTTQDIDKKLKGMVWFEGSRGCDFYCTFCSRRSLRGSGFSGAIPPDHVVDDMEKLSKMGVKSMSATDDDWGGDTERSLEIANKIIERKLPVKFSISTRADHIYDEKASPKENERLKYITEQHKKAGLNRVFLGLESGSPTQLKRYGKQIFVEGNYKAIEILRDLGIDAVAGYIPIDPAMSLTELRENVDFLRKTGMYKKVSNPLSVMRVQEGAAIKNLMENKGLLGSKNEDLVFYDVKGYEDPSVEKIAALAGKWVDDTYPILFGLKGEVATSSLNPDKENKNRLAESVLHDFREVEMNFIEELVKTYERDGAKADVEQTVKYFKEKRDKMVDKARELIKQDKLFEHNPNLVSLIKNY